jgi:hypothetical protein
MQGHSEFYQFATSFWWLIFPLGWGFAGLLRVIFRHHRAEQTLALLKSYADQGKEPPPELLQLLRSEPKPERRPMMSRSHSFLLVGLLFTAMSAAFLVLYTYESRVDPDPGGLMFVVVLMAGFAVAFFIASTVFARDARRQTP